MTLGRREKSLPGKRNSVCSVACKRHGTFREIQLVNMSGVQKTCRKESKDQVGDWLSGGQLSKSYFPYWGTGIFNPEDSAKPIKNFTERTNNPIRYQKITLVPVKQAGGATWGHGCQRCHRNPAALSSARRPVMEEATMKAALGLVLPSWSSRRKEKTGVEAMAREIPFLHIKFYFLLLQWLKA